MPHFCKSISFGAASNSSSFLPCPKFNATYISQVIDYVQNVLKELKTLRTDEDQLPFEVMSEDGTKVVVTAQSTNLPATLRFKEMNQMTEKRKRSEKVVNIVTESFTLKMYQQ